MAVYSGDAYQNLTCLGLDTNGYPTVSISSNITTTYFIAVGGAYFTAAGDYTILISDGDNCENALTNDSCESAETINLSSSPIFSSLANIQGSPTIRQGSYGGSCYLDSGWRTAWYELSLPRPSCVRLSVDMVSYGSGKLKLHALISLLGMVKLSGNASSEPSTFITRIYSYFPVMILNGTCGNLTCVESTSAYSTSLSMKVLPNEDYFVAISGRETGNGFRIDIETIECIQNDSCEVAESRTSLPIIDRTTNEFAAPPDHLGAVCPSYPGAWNKRGVWYKFQGDGSCVRVATWGNVRSYIGVYDGVDCSEMRCVTDSFNDNQVSFRTSAGVSIIEV